MEKGGKTADWRQDAVADAGKRTAVDMRKSFNRPVAEGRDACVEGRQTAGMGPWNRRCARKAGRLPAPQMRF